MAITFSVKFHVIISKQPGSHFWAKLNYRQISKKTGLPNANFREAKAIIQPDFNENFLKYPEIISVATKITKTQAKFSKIVA